MGSEETMNPIADAARIFIPGHYRCPTCGFVLVSSILYVQSGNIGAKDAAGELCPNDGTLMCPVTWEERVKEYAEELLKLRREQDELVAATVEECAKVADDRYADFISQQNVENQAGFWQNAERCSARAAVSESLSRAIRSLHPDAAAILAKRDARVRLAVEQELIAATPAEQVIKDSKRDTWLVASGRASEAYRTLGLAAPLNNDDAKDSPSVKLFIELLTARATELDALEAALSTAAAAKGGAADPLLT